MKHSSSARHLQTPGRLRPTAFGLRRTHRLRLGELLVAQGDLSARNQFRVVSKQSRIEARFGDILLANKLVDKDRLYDAIAAQFDAPVARLDLDPPDPRLMTMFGAQACLRAEVLPWRKQNGRIVVATSRPDQFEAHRNRLEGLFGPVDMAICDERDLHRAILDMQPKSLVERAETRVHVSESCRNWAPRRLFLWVICLMILTLVATLNTPGILVHVALGWAVFSLLAMTLLKIVIIANHVRDRGPTTSVPGTNPAPIIARLPAVSILVPLFHERQIAHHLIKRLSRLDYPRELLDICLVVEADDEITRATLSEIDLPPYMRQIVVPVSALKTKPRAMNYALDFCRGKFVGIYDAEDAPDPDQIRRVVERFHQRGPDVACLQGVLDFYNARTNWMSRCFSIEYATWFRLILPGMDRLGLAIPLGGTTLFFRREVLEELGGWDAHNVTEDADLGIRLARHGYRTELIDTVTQEEANCWFWPWVKQRSRWLKGYAITWAVHMRQPRLLFRELGAWKFFGVQLLFLGTISQFLMAPLLWMLWLVPFGVIDPVSQFLAPGLFLWLTGIFILSEVVSILAGLLAIRGTQHARLGIWVPTMMLYFPMAALAAYKGVLELITRPFYWDKTAHGLDQPSGDPTQGSQSRDCAHAPNAHSVARPGP